MAVLQYRVSELAKASSRLHDRAREQDRAIDQVRSSQAILHEQIVGDGGLQKSVWALRDELKDIRRGIYAFTGTFVVATVTLATAIATHAV